jgi:hypothetical protein
MFTNSLNRKRFACAENGPGIQVFILYKEYLNGKCIRRIGLCVH